MKRLIWVVVCIFCSSLTYADPVDYLQGCWNKQVKPLGKQYYSFGYSEVKRRHYHSFKPWQYTTTKSEGIASIGPSHFAKIDSVPTRKGFAYVREIVTGTDLLYMGIGDTTLRAVTKKEYFGELIETGRYSPVMVLDYFFKNKSLLAMQQTEGFAYYSLTIDRCPVTISIRKTDSLVSSLTILTDEELYGLYGDVESKFTYESYQQVGELPVPMRIAISKTNGKLDDTVMLGAGAIESQIFMPLPKPDNFTWKEDKKKLSDIAIERFSDNIHFVNLRHDDARSMVVEFKDYLLVSEAPLTVANGESIIAEAKKISPSKPIRYFVFNHFHNWYLGGIRPFIHKGVTILGIGEDRPYVEYIANAPHFLTPDSLQMQPRSLRMEEIGDGIIVSDGTYEMKIYLIGEKSDHTYDYLIYYFPKEKMIFQGDLTWVESTGPLQKAGPRQKGLYQAIMDLKLDVKQVVQSWPLKNYGTKNIITFDELERSATMD